MEPALVLVLILSLAVGLAIGLLGGGGSILMVPLLTIVAGWPATNAITGSLFVVGATSLFSTLLHARLGNVAWRLGLIFGAVAMAGAFAGGLFAAFLPDALLLTMFALVMLASGWGMVRKRKNTKRRSPDEPTPWGKVTAVAFAIGVLSGLVGAGGGFLIVPALVLLFGVSMATAVGTSLLVITMQSTSGFVAHLINTPIDWPFALAITLVATLGAVLGVRLVKRIPAAKLRKVFGIFVITMAFVMLGQGLLSA
ncbi:sulfite exporter TauE/SafE family protein [Corynebacterium breve]|uniref:Probable membrane transporter protein n=1 Tax=Corynebacterium breve TaxID=3049799 RepID=A0ABY8VIR4_9CORY|nr:sulfite exporter TauE/SafE family protein [Corynebacterium breve]WIM68133.1 sulfite exporter TauE/SafE family protein [Corynebacterium breve]